MIEILCPTPADTQALAARLAAYVRHGDVIILVGGLGAGKTLFAGGLATGLGVEEPVISPSYVLIRQYDSGFLPLYHVDVYRLSSLNEMDDLDVFQLARDGVLVLEWGDAVEGMLPEDLLRIEFDVHHDQARAIRLIPQGAWVNRELGVAT